MSEKINVNDYIYKDVSHLVPEGSYYSKGKLEEKIKELNKDLKEQDDKIRETKFGITISDGVITKENREYDDVRFINDPKNYDSVPIPNR